MGTAGKVIENRKLKIEDSRLVDTFAVDNNGRGPVGVENRESSRSRMGRYNSDMPDASLIRFVRDVLGCGCPDEVLETIRVGLRTAISETEAEITRMDVGGQLLVYLLSVRQDDPVRPLIAPLLEAGIADRDDHGFNRFRLALATSDPGGIESAARAAFDAFPPPDDRIHLHLVDPDTLPDLTSSPEGPS
jgi:hypothetical protein